MLGFSLKLSAKFKYVNQHIKLDYIILSHLKTGIKHLTYIFSFGTTRQLSTDEGTPRLIIYWVQSACQVPDEIWPEIMMTNKNNPKLTQLIINSSNLDLEVTWTRGLSVYIIFAQDPRFGDNMD